ncbi:MAG: hypothetical protein AAGG51_15955 [Cyanobacteria bacterium P01_G01_bin.54]
MSDQHIAMIEQFYELYAKSSLLDTLSEQEWAILNDLQSLPNLSEEVKSMLSRFSYLVRKQQLQIPVEITVPETDSISRN